MRDSDVSRAYALLSQVNKPKILIFLSTRIYLFFCIQYLSKFDLAPVFTQEDFEYLCKNRPNIVSSFVVEVCQNHLNKPLIPILISQQENGEITDFISYYHLSSTIMNHPQYKTLNACYMYYHAASRTALSDLVSDCLVQAHNVKKNFPLTISDLFSTE